MEDERTPAPAPSTAGPTAGPSGVARPPAIKRKSSGSPSTVPTSRPSPLVQSHTSAGTTTAPSSPIRRVQGFAAPSPLGSGASSTSRRRHSSLSSNVSSATGTEATSLDDSEGEYDSGDAEHEKAGSSGNGAGSMQNMSGQGGTRRLSYGTLFPGYTGGSSQDPYGTSPTSFLPSHAISIPPSSGSVPIAITSALQPAAVRLSTTPLFPSPLAQASGPREDVYQTKGDAGDGESDDEGVGGKPGFDKDGLPVSRDNTAPFGGELIILVGLEGGILDELGWRREVVAR